MEPGKLVMMIIVGILLLIGLYYAYSFLFVSSGVDDLIVYQSGSGGLPALVKDNDSSNANVFSGSNIVPYIYPGGEYSISTWIYVTKWNTDGNKPFLILSNGGAKETGFMTLVMYLGKATNKLGIRMSYGDRKLGWNLLRGKKSSSDNTIVKGDLVLANSVYADSSSGPEKTNLAMDVDSVDIQRWVNITTVISGTTVDVYMDGKLARSSILPGVFTVDDGDKPTITLGNKDGFNGIIGKTRAANVAYSPDRVYNYYQEGPFSTFNLSSLFGVLNPFQYGITVKNSNTVLFTTERA
jgi:hypothetical protein